MTLLSEPPSGNDSDAPVAGVVPVSVCKAMTTKTLRSFVGCQRGLKNTCAHSLGVATFLSSFFGGGVGGVFAVFLFNIHPARPEISSWIWVVVGDIPSAYLPLEDCNSPDGVFKTYMRGMSKWVELARQGRSGTPDDGVPPSQCSRHARMGREAGA